MSQSRILLLGVSLLLAALFLTSCKSDYQASQRQGQGRAERELPRKVKTTAVAETPFGETVTANGTLAAYDQTTVSVKVPGRVRTISVDLGSVVARGQVIAQLDSEDYDCGCNRRKQRWPRRAHVSVLRLTALTIVSIRNRLRLCARRAPYSTKLV
jgi:hypothetical protein